MNGGRVSGEAKAIAGWLGNNRAQIITARSTWTSEGKIRQSAEDDVAVVPQGEAKHGGQAATCRATVTIDGNQWAGDYALRAELLGTSASREKREVAVHMSQIATHDPNAAILLRPWRTAVTTVPAHLVGSPRDGTETVVLDIMQWAQELPNAFEGVSGKARVEQAVELAIPLFSGLDHIHRHHRVVHRDIHPSNVLVAGDGRLVLVDWGIASAVSDGTSTLTAPMGKKGPYLAPETASGQPIGRFTDAWAMGVLLCEMACGEPLVQVGGSGAVELPHSAGALPAWLRAVITGLTKFERQDRMLLEEAVLALRTAGRDTVEAESSARRTYSTTETTAPHFTTTSVPTQGGEDPSHRRDQARELFAAGYEHGRVGRPHLALAAYADAIEVCSGESDLVLRQHLSMALNNAQWTHYQLGQHADAITTCARLVDTLGNDSDLLIRRQVAIGLNSSGYSKRALRQYERAISDWDQVVTRFGNDPDPVLRRQVASALRDKGLALARLDRRIDALSTYTRLIESFERDSDPVMRQQVALALNNKRSCLYALGHHAEAAAACTRLVDVFGVDDDTVVRQQVAIALHSKGLILEASQQRDGALAAYGRLVDAFSTEPDPVVQRSVDWARGRLRAR